MDIAGLTIAVISAVAGIAGAYFAWVPVRDRLSRRRTPRAPAPSDAGAPPVTTGYDVFISYAHEDGDLVRDLAERLRRRGLNIALDEVVLAPGMPLVHGVEEAIRNSSHGMLVFSPASMASGWVRNEYYLLMQRSFETGRLFIPVLVKDVDLPEFARTRFHSDLRDVSDATYDQRVTKLAEALRRTA